jgi:hypothetical protein
MKKLIVLQITSHTLGCDFLIEVIMESMLYSGLYRRVFW